MTKKRPVSQVRVFLSCFYSLLLLFLSHFFVFFVEISSDFEVFLFFDFLGFSSSFLHLICVFLFAMLEESDFWDFEGKFLWFLGKMWDGVLVLGMLLLWNRLHVLVWLKVLCYFIWLKCLIFSTWVNFRTYLIWGIFFFGRLWAWSVNQICKLLFQLHPCVNSMLISWIVHPLSWCFVYLFLLLLLLLLRSLCWLDLVTFCRLLKV